MTGVAGIIRVVVVDDHQLLTESLVRLLGEAEGIAVVGIEPTARAGVERVLATRPDVVLMDYSLPDMDGAAATRLIKASLPEAAVVMLTGSERPGAYLAAMEAGCATWIRKTRAFVDLVDAIRRVAAGERIGADEDGELPPLDQLAVHYQPIVGLADGRVVGFEALVRWDRPGHGLLPPDRFLPLAEATGYVRDIGLHVARVATEECARWHRLAEGRAAPWVSVNMSAGSLSSGNLADDLAALVADAGIAPAALVVELTETMLLEESPEITHAMAGLAHLGVGLALDDLGTAFSSLSYLRRFPFDHVKLDASFTAELPEAPRARRLVESIREMTGALGAAGIAEGVERPDQAACLVAAGWTLAQGFLYSYPVPAPQARGIAAAGVVGLP